MNWHMFFGRGRLATMASILMLATLAPSTIIAGDKVTGGFMKGDTFALILPGDAFLKLFNDHKLWIRLDNGEITILGTQLPQWRVSAFPTKNEFTVRAVKYSKRHDAIRIKIRKSNHGAGWLILQPADIPWKKTLNEKVLFEDPKAASAAVKEWAMEYMLAYLKANAPQLLQYESQDAMMEAWLYWAVKAREENPGLGLADVDGKRFLSVDAGDGSTIYNSLRISQRGMIVRRLSPDLMKQVKRFLPILRKLETIQGLQVSFAVPYRNFLSEETRRPHMIDCQFSVDKTDLEALDALAITDQELLDRSLLICDDTRMKIDLTAIQ